MSLEAAPRTAIVHDWLTGMRGGEKVLERIARFFPDSPIYTLFHFRGTISEELESHPIRASYLQRMPGVREHYRRYLPFFPHAMERLDFQNFDLVVSTSHAVAKGAITRPGAFHLCYCHTPMRYIWDQEEVYFPNRKGLVAAVRGKILERLRRWDTRTADRVDLYLANSHFVAERIEQYYGRESTVLAPPVDTDFYTPADDTDETAGRTYALVVSALAPYKRVDLAIAACEEAGIELRIVGDGTERAALEAKAGPKTRFLGRVSEEELRELYRGAHCFVQPGVEDFGISSVEALACGAPIVALGRGGIRDIVFPEKQGILVGEPESSTAQVGELAAAIDQIQRIRFSKLNLRQRAEYFSAQNFDDRFQTLIQNIQTVNLPPTPHRGAH